MRGLAVGVLGLALGCNQIFGIKDTRVFDGAVDVPPPVPKHTYLAWGIGQLQPSGQPDPMIDYVGIGFETSRPARPTIRVGPELDANGDASLADAVYEPAPSGTEQFPGGFDVPDELLGRHWRMVFMLPDDPVPHEVQWTVSSAYLVIPRLTRRDAAPVPDNSGYSITPVGGPTLIAPSIMTSGVWTSTTDLHYSGKTFLPDFVDAQALTGPAGAPESSKGDWVLATDWTSLDQYETSVDGWAMTQVDLVAGEHPQPTPQPTWRTGTAKQIPIQANGLNCGRLDSAQPDFFPMPTTCKMGTSLLAYGMLPAPGLPAFGADGRPLFLSLDNSTIIKTMLTVFDVDASVPLPRALYSKLVSDRTYNSLTLESSLEVVTQDLTGTLVYPAALTTNEQLTDDANTSTFQLDTDADGSRMLAISSDVLLFKYTYESTQNASADELEITLFEIVGSALQPVRQYIVPDAATSVRIDRKLLVSGHTYVFRTTSHRGYPSTTNGDYRTVTYPFGQSTKFSGTFVVQ